MYWTSLLRLMSGKSGHSTEISSASTTPFAPRAGWRKLNSASLRRMSMAVVMRTYVRALPRAPRFSMPHATMT